MKRYTVKPEAGITAVGSRCGVIQDVIDKPMELFRLFDRLGEYEDTGLEPEDIAVLKEKQTPIKPQEVLLVHGRGYECGNCGNELSVSEFDGIYCHWCGQKLDWEN